jgi:hypothetical protein
VIVNNVKDDGYAVKVEKVNHYLELVDPTFKVLRGEWLGISIVPMETIPITNDATILRPL